MVYLPTKLGDFVRANVGKYSIHGAYGKSFMVHVYVNYWLLMLIYAIKLKVKLMIILMMTL